MALSDKLRSLRDKHNWSQKFVANLMKVDRTTLSRYETGKSVPNYQTVVELAEIYGVDKSYLVNELDPNDIPSDSNTVYTLTEETEKLELDIIQKLLKREPSLKKALLELYTLDDKSIKHAAEVLGAFVRGIKQNR